jgi:putative ABC transport system permease protein
MRSQFYDQLLQRVAALPGVESVGATSQLPLTRYNMGGTLRVMDRAAETGKREVSAPITAVSSDYFRTMGIGLRAGRFFDESEAPGTASVTLLSETLARKLFPESDPVGKRIFVAGSGAEWTTVIGVVDEIRHQGLDQAIEEVAYLNIQQLPRPMMALVLRCSLSPLSLAPSLRQAVTEMDPALPIFDVMTMKARLAKSVAGRRFNLLLLGTFAALALLLAGVGVYGVIAYLVSDRTREVGIRMALGAQCRDVQRLVLRQGLTLAGLGIGIGLPGALAATQLLRSLLFGISPIDPVTYLVIPLLVLGVAGLACWVPARRAARVDPMVALRCE